MSWSDVIELGTLTEVTEYGETIVSYVYREVFADKKSVRSKEFYESRLLGLKPELMFEVRTSEYNEEPKLKFNSKVYDIIRTYEKGEFTELICSAVFNGT
jgi:head-tail adaptor